MSGRLWRDAEMYEADEGTGSMEQDAERRWVVPVERPDPQTLSAGDVTEPANWINDRRTHPEQLVRDIIEWWEKEVNDE